MTNALNQCGSNVVFSVGVTDNCPGASVVSVPASGSAFPIGVTLVTSTATDASGNTSVCTFNVIVRDVTPPVIACPADITVNAPLGTCVSNVTFTVNATDLCGAVSVVSVPASGFAFPVGTNVVTSTATDASGNTSVCTFNEIGRAHV